MRFRSKRYKKDADSAVQEKLPLDQAVQKVQSWKSTKFDQTVECVVNLGIDPRQADQTIRSAISLLDFDDPTITSIQELLCHCFTQTAMLKVRNIAYIDRLIVLVHIVSDIGYH